MPLPMPMPELLYYIIQQPFGQRRHRAHFVLCSLLFVVCCVLFVVCCLVFVVVCCVLCVVFCVLCVGCWVFFVVCCLLFGVWLLFVVRCFLSKIMVFGGPKSSKIMVLGCLGVLGLILPPGGSQEPHKDTNRWFVGPPPSRRPKCTQNRWPAEKVST